MLRITSEYSESGRGHPHAPNMSTPSKIILPKLSFQVTGCCFVVHNTIGRYASEPQYADAVAVALQNAGLSFEREKVLPLSFVGERVGRSRADFLIMNRLVLELKARPVILRADYDQAKRYLQALNLPLALVVNFHQRYLHPKRVLNASAPNVSDVV